VDDFLKTVFLPCFIQNNLGDYSENNNAQELLNAMRPDMISTFLKGVPITTIIELSDHWHNPGTEARLNKAKTFSSQKWEPLLTDSIIYEHERGPITIMSLTSSGELKQEGEDLAHCVGGYTSDCLMNNSHILSLRDEGGTPLSTIEFHLLRGNGDNNNSRVVNIEGETRYHLVRNQHYGYRNRTPPQQCSDVEKKFFNEIRSGKVKVNLSELEIKHEERVTILNEEKDIVLVGYNPTNEKSFEKARKKYRKYGLKIKTQRKTLKSNYNNLAGTAT